ncbi:unnamed protein product [Polarella glacialis]|uniref:Uncharacterized protein n=1 Tax=Polarella glacialis TaxID=89957 RepID=A0A813M7V2_POLGL|nr:unnamed protein product [Polarella glacialis]
MSSLEVSSFALTAEDVADAAEELAKADCCAEDAWEGFAVAAALTACELERASANAAAAVTASLAPATEGIAHNKAPEETLDEVTTTQSAETQQMLPATDPATASSTSTSKTSSKPGTPMATNEVMSAAAGEAECDVLQQPIQQACELERASANAAAAVTASLAPAAEGIAHSKTPEEATSAETLDEATTTQSAETQQMLPATDPATASSASTSPATRTTTAAAAAKTTTKPATRMASAEIMSAAAGEAECDALQQRIQQAEELGKTVLSRCPHRGLARRILSLYEPPLYSASEVVRQRRAAQWRCVARLLWRFKSTLPFMVLSSLLSMVLGAFSAMRLHYTAAVINIAKDAATSSAGGLPRGRGGVGETIGAMVVSEVIVQLAEFARARMALRGKAKVIQELKVALFAALLRQDLDYLEQCDLWQLRSLIGSCGTTVGQVVDFPATMVEASCRLAAAALALSRQNGRLAAFLTVLLPLRFLLGELLGRLGEWLENQSCLPDFRGQINSCWSALVRPASLRTMRAFAREPIETATFKRFLTVHDRLQERGQMIYRLQQPARALLEHGSEIAALWYGSRLALRGEMDFGELSSALLVAQSAFDGARFAHAAASSVSAHALGPLAQMAALLARRPRIGIDEPPLSAMPDPKAVKWSIKFQDVYFAYPGRQGAWVLQGLSFEASAGEFLGVLGTTGAGKSTILHLLLRFYEPSRGRIFLDGRDICEYNPLWLRQHIGFVSQELVLCKRTVRENLLYGCTPITSGGSSTSRSACLKEPSDDEARAALRLAQCEDTFFNQKTFPNLWHTDVGDSGSDLSGGERQRLAVARALLKRPRLLLLDEATSALDELSQARLQEGIEELRRTEGLTVVCVAHRLSNLANADRLLVLADGRAAEQGTPTELLARPGGVFAEFARAHQASLPGTS